MVDADRGVPGQTDSPAAGTIHKGNRPLTTIDQWRRSCFDGAKRGHWKDERSAKENARAWLDAAPGLQPGDRTSPCSLSRHWGPASVVGRAGSPHHDRQIQWTTEHRSPRRRPRMTMAR